MTTYDEARQCPKCGQPGEVTEKKPASRDFPRGTEVHIVKCRNPLCVWLDEVSQIVQINPDGSIPPPSRAGRGSKMWPSLPDRFKEVEESLERQIQQETSQRGGEVYRGR